MIDTTHGTGWFYYHTYFLPALLGKIVRNNQWSQEVTHVQAINPVLPIPGGSLIIDRSDVQVENLLCNQWL